MTSYWDDVLIATWSFDRRGPEYGTPFSDEQFKCVPGVDIEKHAFTCVRRDLLESFCVRKQKMAFDGGCILRCFEPVDAYDRFRLTEILELFQTLDSDAYRVGYGRRFAPRENDDVRGKFKTGNDPTETWRGMYRDEHLVGVTSPCAVL